VICKVLSNEKAGPGKKQFASKEFNFEKTEESKTTYTTEISKALSISHNAIHRDVFYVRFSLHL
jgi:hypothetical protein